MWPRKIILALGQSYYPHKFIPIKLKTTGTVMRLYLYDHQKTFILWVQKVNLPLLSKPWVISCPITTPMLPSKNLHSVGAKSKPTIIIKTMGYLVPYHGTHAAEVQRFRITGLKERRLKDASRKDNLVSTWIVVSVYCRWAHVPDLLIHFFTQTRQNTCHLKSRHNAAVLEVLILFQFELK